MRIVRCLDNAGIIFCLEEVLRKFLCSLSKLKNSLYVGCLYFLDELIAWWKAMFPNMSFSSRFLLCTGFACHIPGNFRSSRLKILHKNVTLISLVLSFDSFVD